MAGAKVVHCIACLIHYQVEITPGTLLSSHVNVSSSITSTLPVCHSYLTGEFFPDQFSECLLYLGFEYCKSPRFTHHIPKVADTPGTPAVAGTPPGTPSVVDSPPGTPTFVDLPPGTPTFVDTPPGTPTVVDTPPGTLTVVDTPPGTQTVVNTPPGTPTFVDTPPGTLTVVYTPPGTNL